MVIKKENLGTILEFNGTSFLLDPKEFRAKENYTIISSKLIKEKNFDKIFAFPGEYNVGNVFIYSFLNENDSLSHLFETEEGFLLFTNSYISEENIKKIKEITQKIEALCFFEKFKFEDIFKKFNSDVLITKIPINLSNFSKNKGKSFKINLKRSEKQIYILE
jgi:hypothetical protein